MSFTTPCFIRKNTPELQEKLAELGYKRYGNPFQIIDNSRLITTLDGEYVPYNVPLDNSWIDCGINESLFLAVAALQDDSDAHQWFIDKENKWLQCQRKTIREFIDIAVMRGYGVSDLRKATVPELIEHFKIGEGRKFTFGKHKGEFILEIIRKQPWYVEWLLKNVDRFKLSQEELLFYNQTCTDWQEAWDNVRYAFKRGPGAAKEIYKTVEAYKKGEINPHPSSATFHLGLLNGIQQQFSKAIEYNPYSEWNEIDDICFGCDPMALF